MSRHKHIHRKEGAKPHKCDHPGCNWSFQRKETLIRHKETVHCDNDGAETFRCENDGCDYTTTSKGRFDRHMARCGKFHSCETCGEKFADIRTLHTHIVKEHFSAQTVCPPCLVGPSPSPVLAR